MVCWEFRQQGSAVGPTDDPRNFRTPFEGETGTEVVGSPGAYTGEDDGNIRRSRRQPAGVPHVQSIQLPHRVIHRLQRPELLKHPVRRQPLLRLPSTRLTGTLPGIPGPLWVEQHPSPLRPPFRSLLVKTCPRMCPCGGPVNTTTLR